MDEILEVLNGILENPDDLSSLPGVIEQLQEYETTATTRATEDLERITNLQNANRNLLSQIPINTGQTEDSTPEDDQPTFEQAQEQLVNAMKNIGGY